MKFCVAERSAVKSIVRAISVGCSVALTTLPAAQPTSAQEAGAGVSYAIPAGNLGPALTRWAQLSGYKLLAPGNVLQGRTTSGLSGSYQPQQALGELLSGTGLSYSIDGTTVTVSDPAADNAGVTIDGAIALDTINVSGGSAAAPAADTPFETAGSVSHISREQIDRVPPVSAGDLFINAPGVINAGNRVGTSINPNIRGMQGMGRVNTTVDGARQNTSSYRGYIGNRDETYIDPDLVGGIDISKGPSNGAGVGGIAGNVGIRTIEAGDIVRDGETTSTRIKGSLGGNTSAPQAVGTTDSASRPNWLGDTYSGSIATATIRDNYEGVIAYSRRKTGNYFVGTNVPDGIVFPPGIDVDGDGHVSTSSSSPDFPANTPVHAGAEAMNTSEDTQSILLKGKMKWGDGQSLQLGYMLYDSKHGEIDELRIAPWYPNEQLALTKTRVDTYTAQYRWNPLDNALINLRANLWFSNVNVDRGSNGLDERDHQMRTLGGDIGNTSRFETALGDLKVDNGLEFVREHATAFQFPDNSSGADGWGTYGPSGVRFMTSAYSMASLDLTEWLNVTGGARYDHYNTEGEGYLTRFPTRSGSRLSPNASVTITPVEGLQLFGSYAEGYRPPSLRESHWKYRGLLVNNPELDPEISQNMEVGFNILRDDAFISDDKLRFKASYFRNHYQDYIVRGLVPGSTSSVYHWTNIDEANYEGLELSGSYDAGAWFVEGAVNKYFKVEYCVAGEPCFIPTMGGFTGSADPLKNDYNTSYIPPEYSGNLTAGIRLLDERMTIGGRMHYASVRMGSSWGDAYGTSGQVGYQFTWPKYVVFDTFGSFKLTEDAMLAWSIENITDEYYYGALSSVGIPSPGRTARLSLTRTLGGDMIPSIPDLTLGRAAEGEPGSNWTGLYVGAHIGYSFVGMDGTTTAGDGTPGGIPATESANLDLKDTPRGGQIGVNYQLPNGVVLGVEGDVSWDTLNAHQKAVATEGTLGADDWMQANTTYSFDWSATLRGRIGYAFDRFLVYGTGGIAFLKEEQTRTQYQSNTGSATLPYGRNTQPFFSETASALRQGWTAGAGFEYALTNHWSLKGEYQYSGFGVEKFLFPDAREGVTQGYRVRCTPFPQCYRDTGELYTNYPGTSETANGRKASNELDLHTIKLGVNYRF